MISEIISIVNLIAIIILFILFFTKNNKENFTGAPSGYTDLLVSDPDGNLDTFSLTTLETDIDTKITDAITKNNTSIASTYQTKAEASAAKTAADASYQPAGNYIRSGQVISMSGYWGGKNQGDCRMLIGPQKGGAVEAGHGAGAGGCVMETGWFNQWVIN